MTSLFSIVLACSWLGDRVFISLGELSFPWHAKCHDTLEREGPPGPLILWEGSHSILFCMSFPTTMCLFCSSPPDIVDGLGKQLPIGIERHHSAVHVGHLNRRHAHWWIMGHLPLVLYTCIHTHQRGEEKHRIKLVVFLREAEQETIWWEADSLNKYEISPALLALQFWVPATETSGYTSYLWPPWNTAC